MAMRTSEKPNTETSNSPASNSPTNDPTPTAPTRSPGAWRGSAFLLAVLLPLLPILGACGGPEPAGSAPATSPPVPQGDALRVEDARAVQVPGTGTGAAYFRLVNPTEKDDLLLAVDTPVARAAEVHETLEEEGLMRMQSFPEGMPVPARSVVVLEPGGKHVMLLALHENLPVGEEIPLTLELRDAGSVELSVPVEALGGGGP